ncbi:MULTISPECIES: hypothetical protein [unclassified Nostoc]|uniref:hypothetical protein n=1 Tax=unclassified Nostoc TaxID=2593658 RepID=UPI002AD52378|nr:hypothetical protein [Nostoc sp. DedQUE03]MDZ7974145.1 hypothetical protein [Nostoc sp. DedQUE03]MDZ8042960.1 hypothetical protein [Nostoc sp. DedQUE02]
METAIAFLIYQAIAFSYTFKLRITAKIRLETAIAFLIYQAMIYDGLRLRIHRLHPCSSDPLPPLLPLSLMPWTHLSRIRMASQITLKPTATLC